MGLSYSKEYEVNYYDVDSNLECNTSKLLSMFSDIGNRQMEHLGYGVNEYLKEGITWVFYNYTIDIKRNPKFGEKLKVTTVAEGLKKFYALRTYEIQDEDGEVIVTGDAIFFLIDIEKRKAIRIPQKQYEIFQVKEEMKGDFKLPRLRDFGDITSEEEFKTRYSDIDSNNHVNNTKYVDWAVETVPEEVFNNFKISNLNVIFEKECRYGQKIKVITKINDIIENNLKTEHKIINENNETLARLEGIWTKK